MSKSRRSIHSFEPHRFMKEHRKIDPHEKRRLLRAHSNVLREQSETERHKSLLRVGRTVLSVVAHVISFSLISRARLLRAFRRWSFSAKIMVR